MANLMILYFAPGKEPEYRVIDNTLESAQRMVDGYIECIYPFEGDYVLVCNEEGKLRGMDPNRIVNDDVICGPFFICKTDADGDFASIDTHGISPFHNACRPYDGRNCDPWTVFYSFKEEQI